MTLTTKLEEFMKKKEAEGLFISSTPSTRILMGYYVSLGLEPETSIRMWLYDIANGKYPAYGSVTRAIRQARHNNPRWKKQRKVVDSQVKNIKEEIGYGTIN